MPNRKASAAARVALSVNFEFLHECCLLNRLVLLCPRVDGSVCVFPCVSFLGGGGPGAASHEGADVPEVEDVLAVSVAPDVVVRPVHKALVAATV